MPAPAGALSISHCTSGSSAERPFAMSSTSTASLYERQSLMDSAWPISGLDHLGAVAYSTGAGVAVGESCASSNSKAASRLRARS